MCRHETIIAPQSLAVDRGGRSAHKSWQMKIIN
jgi:hypothetical protein